MVQVSEKSGTENRNVAAEPQLKLFEIEAEPVETLSDIHTSKRGRRERKGVHSWHAYYAGYAEKFVSDVLDVIAKPGDLVLDPWNGSGTTTLTAQYRGYQSLGIDANPVMAIHAQAKSLRVTREKAKIEATAESILRLAKNVIDEQVVPKALEAWVHTEPAKALLALRTAIQEHTTDSPVPEFLQPYVTSSNRYQTHTSKQKAFFLSALFQVLREVGKFRRGSNPTWLVIDESTPSTRNDIVFALFRQKIESMQHDLSRYAGKFNKTANFWVMIGDSRDMSLKHDVIDVVVTSPPYCTRIDYVVSTKPELLLLDHSEGEIDNLRRGNIGAPVIVNKDLGNQPVWGELCNAFLQGVANHASKASRSYYLPIYQQYFYDAERSLREIRRTLKKGGRAAIVVQSSYYKELELPLGDIYVQIASNLDLYAEIGRREVVRQHMAHINTKSSEYVKNKVYYEDVVYVEK